MKENETEAPTPVTEPDVEPTVTPADESQDVENNDISPPAATASNYEATL